MNRDPSIHEAAQRDASLDTLPNHSYALIVSPSALASETPEIDPLSAGQTLEKLGFEVKGEV